MARRKLTGEGSREIAIRALIASLMVIGMSGPTWGAELPGGNRFREHVLPVLETYCYECHGDGANEGEMTLDGFATDEELLASRDSWWTVVKNLRSGVMPPVDYDRPTDEEIARIRDWVKADVFGIDASDPDPGRVVLRRMNRLEYRNTIRDLMGVDYDTRIEFPPDDTGFGFDNNGDVLSISPLLLEKYMQAAETIVSRAVPTTARVAPEQAMTGADFADADGSSDGEQMSFYEPAEISRTVHVEHAGDYRLLVDLHVTGPFEFDPGRCRVTLSVDGEQRLQEEYVCVSSDDPDRGETFRYEFAEAWQAGDHRLDVVLEPLVKRNEELEKSREDPNDQLTFSVRAVKVQGPLDRKYWVAPEGYDRFFADDPAPDDAVARREYAREVLEAFALRALCRPAERQLIDSLLPIAEGVYSRPDKTFEEGIARAMVALLASPRFLFRMEGPGTTPAGKSHPLVDEYALASRLSYFLWSTMPDAELFRLAEEGELRDNLAEQVRRMLASPRSAALVKNFTGQWLQARHI